MTPTPSRIVFLGPQRQSPTVHDALAKRIEAQAPVAAVTAGWEERESEHLELVEHVDRAVENLELHRRADEVFAGDAQFHAAIRQFNDQLRELQKLYQIRLRHQVPAAEELLRREGATEALIEPEIEAAFASLRALDQHHLERVADLREGFRHAQQLDQRQDLGQHRQEIAAALQRTAALCIAGGNVEKLFNRLWMFDVLSLLPTASPIIAWSAGAMVLADRIVLFHDSPPQGKGHAEIWGPGLAACSGILPLPHASARLRLDDSIRVQLFARRFPQQICAALDAGAELLWDGVTWTAPSPTRQLAPSGELVDV